jgi:hypothetical protein
MTRAAAIAAAEAYFDDGGFVTDLARRVAIPTESQIEERLPVLRAYLADEIAPSLARLGFTSEVVDNPVRGGPMLIAERPKRAPRRPSSDMAMATSFAGSSRNGATGCRRGACSGRVTASTGAAPPTTRASTRSTSPRSKAC